MPVQKLSAQNNGWTKKKLRYSEETLRFPKYYIGWIGIGNCGQKTSKEYPEHTLIEIYISNGVKKTY